MDFSLLGLWNQMGVVAKLVVIILLVMSMLAIGVSIERLLSFRKGRRRSLEYIATLQPLIGTPGRLHEALKLPPSSYVAWPPSPSHEFQKSVVRDWYATSRNISPRLPFLISQNTCPPNWKLYRC